MDRPDEVHVQNYSIEELRAHVEVVAKNNKIYIEWHDHERNCAYSAEVIVPDKTIVEAFAVCGLHFKVNEIAKVVHAHVIDDETSYAVVMHELGHHLHEHGRNPEIENYLREECAWEWVQGHALMWTAAMQQTKDYGMNTYYQKLVLDARDVRHAKDSWSELMRDIKARHRTIKF